MERDSHLNRYTAVVQCTARVALDRAQETPGMSAKGCAHDRALMTLGLAPARMLLDPALADPEVIDPGLAQLAQGPLRYDDSLGHTRPAYLALLIHLHARTGVASPDGLSAAVSRLTPSDDVGTQLWRALCFASAPEGDPVPIVEAIVNQPGPHGELHAFVEGKDLLEAWWYRELVGLHALFNLAYTTAFGCVAWRCRVDEVCRYHLENTQPDHTTAQPWGVGAFLSQLQTSPFGEQQLHDAQSYWTHGQPGSATIPGLLLADAACTMEQLQSDA